MVPLLGGGGGICSAQLERSRWGGKEGANQHVRKRDVDTGLASLTGFAPIYVVPGLSTLQGIKMLPALMEAAPYCPRYPQLPFSTLETLLRL